MLNFNQAYRPNTFFGNGTIMQLEKIVEKYNSALLVYGGNSLKASGTYEQIIKQCSKISVLELDKVSENPKLSDIKRAYQIVNDEPVDLIIAAGGGSVIDAAKAIAVALKTPGDVWDIYAGKNQICEAIDIVSIITNVATGSETNDISVLVNDDLKLKRSIKSPIIYPKYAIMDPKLTVTVKEYTTRYGLIDTFSHLMEQYFNNYDNSIIDGYIIGLMQETIEVANLLLNDLSNVELREKHMLLAYLAYNCDIRNMVGGDFACHGLDHGLASECNTTHGAGLAIIMPNWMEYVSAYKPSKIAKLGEALFGLSIDDEKQTAMQTSVELRKWLKSLNAVEKYSELNVIIDSSVLKRMVKKAQVSYPLGNYYQLDESAIKIILEKGL